MYTHTVTDADLNAHAEELMGAASEFQLQHLHQKCEMFLCWKVQVKRTHVFVSRPVHRHP